MQAALAFYLVAAGAVVLAAVARIVVLRAQHTRPGDLGRPYGHIELSLLAQNPRRAVLASLGVLRAAGSVDAHSWGALRAEQPPPDEATAVDRAVYAAAARGASLVSVHRDETVVGALAVVEEELRAAGALSKEPSKRFYGWVRWPMLGAFLLGATALPIAYGGSALAGIALFLTAGPFVLLAVAVVEHNSGISRLGRRVLRQAKAYDLGTAVALEGVEPLWAADPVFAKRARLPKPDPDRSTGGKGGANQLIDGGDAQRSGRAVD